MMKKTRSFAAVSPDELRGYDVHLTQNQFAYIMDAFFTFQQSHGFYPDEMYLKQNEKETVVLCG